MTLVFASLMPLVLQLRARQPEPGLLLILVLLDESSDHEPTLRTVFLLVDAEAVCS